MTDGGELPPGVVRQRESSARTRRERAERTERAERARVEIGGLDDWELIGAIPPIGISYPMEMDRRLKDAVEALAAETVTSRESSERLTGQLDASIASLTAETVKARESSERVGRWLIVLTVVLVLLTAALVALPFVQAATSADRQDPAPSPSARLAPQSHSGPAARAPSPAASSDGATGLRP